MLDLLGNPTAPAAVATIIAGALLLRIAYSLLFHPLARYPGPLIARLGLPALSWTQINGARGDILRALDDAHTRYGSYVRIGYNEISTVDPDAVPVLYSANSKWTKANFYLTFKAPLAPHNLLSAMDPIEHGALRRSSAPAYSMNNVLKLQSSVQQQATSLCRLLLQHCDSHVAIDVGLRLQYFASDVVGAMAFGHDDGFGLLLADADEHGLLHSTHTLTVLNYTLGCWHWLGPRVWRTLGYVLPVPPAVVHLTNVAAKNIAQRKKHVAAGIADEDDKQLDMLDIFIRSKDPLRNGQPLTDMQVLGRCMTVLRAGSDTASTTMQAFLMFCLITPGVMDAVVAEIDTAFDNGALSWPPRHSEVTTKLPYFNAARKETLRVWPAVSFVLPRRAPQGDASIGTHYFPSGTVVGMSASHYHRRATDVFGEDAAEFRPQRWLHAAPSQRTRMESNLLTFGSGTRVCIGRNISMLEMSIALPMLLRVFTWTLTPRTSNGPHKHPQSAFGPGADKQTWNVHASWFAMPKDLYCTLTRRQVDETV